MLLFNENYFFFGNAVIVFSVFNDLEVEDVERFLSKLYEKKVSMGWMTHCSRRR